MPRRDFIMFDGNGQPISDIGEEEHRLASLWEDALGAALDACCAGWNEQPLRGFWLSIDTGTGIIRPRYTEPPIATFRLGDEQEGGEPSLSAEPSPSVTETAAENWSLSRAARRWTSPA
jgi:hypothetical protein